MNKFARALLLGSLLWLAATIALRLAGGWLLRPGMAALLVALALGTVLMALAGPLLRLLVSRDRADADTAALGLVLPGIVGDALVTLAFEHVYPNLSPVLGSRFAALALWYYGVAALAISLHARLAGGSNAGADDGRSGRDRRGDHDQGVARPA